LIQFVMPGLDPGIHRKRSGGRKPAFLFYISLISVTARQISNLPIAMCACSVSFSESHKDEALAATLGIAPSLGFSNPPFLLAKLHVSVVQY